MTDIESTETYRKIQTSLVQMVPLTLRFTYEDSKGEVTQRHVEPYEIKGDRLFAHCLDRDSIRQFKIEKMEGVIHGEKFRPRHAIVVPV